MSEKTVHKVADLSDIALGKTHRVSVGDEDILLCRTSDGVYAVSNKCSHAAADLCDGKLKGHRIFCPLHSAAFDVRTGEALSRPASKPIESYEVVIEGEDILVSLVE
ncbi:MAG: Rieske (2Fe-2S) protein [Pseudomonadales bacterium]